MLQLHFYSNHAGQLVLNNEFHDCWSFDTYPLEIIKEFEQVSLAWRLYLANLLRRGNGHSKLPIYPLGCGNFCYYHNKFAVLFKPRRRKILRNLEQMLEKLILF